MEKCDFLLDRVMRGKHELDESKIKVMVLNMLDYNRKQKMRTIKVEFKDIHRWADIRYIEESNRGLTVNEKLNRHI